MSAAAFVAAYDVSRETFERLETYADLLRKWNKSINLVSPGTLDALWERHFLDSAQLLDLMPENATRWVDLGTGGGFPGLIAAILAAERATSVRVTCVESDQRKATFLRTVVRETGIEADIVTKRIEGADPQNADVVSARALAPLPQLLWYAERHLAPTGTGLFLKGVDHAREIEEALETWTFRADTYPSRTNPDAVILKIGDLGRA